MSMTPASSSYFQQNARQWDRLRAGYFGEEVRAAAIARAYLRPEMVVADVGAGTGYLAAGLAPLVRRVILLDGSREMLAVAQSNLGSFDNLEFHATDGLDLPLPDDSVDAVFANMYLHHCPDPLATIREMVRILVPGGRLVITDLDAHPYAWLKDEMADAWQGFEREQVHGWMKEAGLVNRIVDCSGSSCCAQSEHLNRTAEDKSAARISVFVAAGTKRVAAVKAVRAHYTAAIQPRTGCGCAAGAAENNPTSEDTASGCCGEPASLASCCSSPGERAAAFEDPFVPGYSAEEQASAPSEAVEVAFGCGNPTALAGLEPGESVLDIGSGGGIDAFLAARKVGPGGRVIGVDTTPAMIARAAETARRNGISNVEFRLGEAEALPVENGEVDVILSNCVINLVEDKGQVFTEAYRVLKPGGRLEVSDMLASGSLPPDAHQDAASWAACLSGALPEQEYLDLIRQAGFHSIQVRRSPAEVNLRGTTIYSAQVSARK